MAAVRRLCAGGIYSVRVVHGDGQVLHLAPNVKVVEVLRKYPHHYICHSSPDQSSKSKMLPLETELDSGSVYFLLPLPRLFPSFTGSASPSCSCYEHEGGRGEARSPLIFPKGGFSSSSVKHMITKIGSPIRTPKKKVSPDPPRSNPYSSDLAKEENPILSPVYKHKRSNSLSPNRSKSPKSNSPHRSRNNSNERGRESPVNCNRWKPRLGCISETDAMMTTFEELRSSLDRRRLTFESRGRPGSPLRLGDFSGSPTRMGSGPSPGDFCSSPARSR